ncbi:oxysterol-binding protein related protein OSH3 CYBJADRAFT_169307 [Cyberlindnera jadinii NRRL Y-1542]|uniref:PH domain-containing protein n=1 Tax=Cyberlindnera jadinii (strain ATCC 18201 / CBS 1600 / BCRC 20928 / JCM 3617 / NBRC 0987 / NRRL Y-1542) TaxID=983966 RepID=A0A1E4RWU1_CYBJN|nr:hypothetical protein CYBJADRAFT_169307 [Cyberlindnera jadinii NRRL Y-1542]ODV71690.1 hypothetical protein CYBJADRAFT_169307 [Cyberlindnera jadinii NRRL Y-1542]
METIDIHSRSFAVKWIHVPDGSHVIFQLKPLKRSIKFSVYQSTEDKVSPTIYGATGLGESGNSSTTSLQQIKRSSSTRSMPLDERLRNSQLVEVKSYGMLQGNQLFKEELKLDHGGIFAFVFDNTFSKSYSKKVLFNKFFVENKPAIRRLSTSASSVNLQSQLHPRNGQYLQGYLLKKKRKKLQGFTKRFFVLNFKYNTLSYYLNENTHKFRGEMQINLSTVSAFKEDNTIVIDSGMEVWILKTLNDQDWSNWINALDFIKLNSTASQPPQQPSQSSAENTDTSAMASPQFLPSSSKENADLFAKIEEENADVKGHHPEEFSIINQKLDELHSTLAHLESTKDDKDISAMKEQLQSLSLYVNSVLESQDMNITVLSPTNSVFSDDYYDAHETLESNEYDQLDNHVLVLQGQKTSLDSNISVDDLSDADESVLEFAPKAAITESAASRDLSPLPLEKIKRRNDVKPSTTNPPSLFSFLRKNVGKDLSTISMPVTYNEPLTILQKFSEMFEHGDILNQAATETNQDLRTLKVAAFAVANLGSFRSKQRNMRKPFNPILGETYELVDENVGFRMIGEKVSHKPQIFAFHCESSLWELSFSVSPDQKFWGKSIELVNNGTLTLVFKATGEILKWSQPTTIVKNIIAGDRYTEPSNNVIVTSSSGMKSVVEFKKPTSGMFSTPRCEEVKIKVMDKAGKKSEYYAEGKWTNEITIKKGNDSKFSETIYEASELLRDESSKWGFSIYASNLNQITLIEKGKIPFTDSRLRPDVRMYEDGDVDGASEMKLALEQRQRDRRKEVADANQVHVPSFFAKSNISDDLSWELIKGSANYWERRKVGNWDGLTELW